MRGAPEDRAGQLLVEARRRSLAFGELYRLAERDLVGFFYRRTACASTAADLTSETFAAAITSVRRYDPKKGTGMQWLFGIARNLLLQWQRQERVEQRARRRAGMRLELGTAGDLEQIEDLVDFSAMREPLIAALGDLTEGVRDAVLLRIVDRLDYETIAERLGCTVGTARVRVSRGLDRLHQRLETTWAR